MPDFTLTTDLIRQGLSLALEYWWAYVPVLVGMAAYHEWFAYQREKFLASLKWVVLEITPPPDVPFSTPRAAENIFAGLHATYLAGTGWKAQFFQGKVPVSFSFEIVSHGGETHFFIRCLEGQRNLIESLVFAQYPAAEMRIVPDYFVSMPPIWDPSQHDVSGAELEFTKENAYPIKTYPEFEEAGGKDEYSRLDPIAPLVEVMSSLRPGEQLGIQYIIRATGGAWVKEGQKVIDKLAGKPEKPADIPLIGKVLLFPFTLLEKVLTEFGAVTPAEPKKEEKMEFNLQKLTPSQKRVLEVVEDKLAKLAFKTGIRVLYVATKESFNGSRIASVTGMFKQLYYNNLNSFKPANGTWDQGFLKWIFPNDKGFFADERTFKKKMKIYSQYRDRAFPQRDLLRDDGDEVLPILNTEELATLWHLPSLNVKAPLLPRVQAKKGQPPAILPTR